MILMMRRIFESLVHSDTLRAGTLPTSADAVAANAIALTHSGVAWTFGAWIQIALAAVVAAETQIVGFSLENFVGVPAQGEIEIVVGVAPAGAAIARFQTAPGFFILPKPIRIPAGTAVVARYRNANAVADTVDIKLNTMTGF